MSRSSGAVSFRQVGPAGAAPMVPAMDIRIEGAEDRAGEDHDAAAVPGGVFLEVVLDAQPQLHAVVELGSLRPGLV
jgi:hypothetical protein